MVIIIIYIYVYDELKSFILLKLWNIFKNEFKFIMPHWNN